MGKTALNLYLDELIHICSQISMIKVWKQTKRAFLAAKSKVHYGPHLAGARGRFFRRRVAR